MTAPVIAPNPAGPFDPLVWACCVWLLIRIADLEHQVQAARQTVGAEQDAHSVTRLLLPPRRERTDLDAKVAAASQPIAEVRARRGEVQ